MGAVTAGVVGIPAAISALSPLWKTRPEAWWRPIGELHSFPVGGVHEATVFMPRDDWARNVRVKSVYVWRPTEDRLVVYSRNCTDLSCPIVWDPGSQWFLCPCHGGIFDQEGEPKAGPPPRPLYRYANRVRNGVLEIDLRSLPPMT
jgi:menaquinol-cytochrome c reductase iron-sulfur subunit